MYNRHEMMTGIMYIYTKGRTFSVYIHTVESNKMLTYRTVSIVKVPHRISVQYTASSPYQYTVHTPNQYSSFIKNSLCNL